MQKTQRTLIFFILTLLFSSFVIKTGAQTIPPSYTSNPSNAQINAIFEDSPNVVISGGTLHAGIRDKQIAIFNNGIQAGLEINEGLFMGTGLVDGLLKKNSNADPDGTKHSDFVYYMNNYLSASNYKYYDSDLTSIQSKAVYDVVSYSFNVTLGSKATKLSITYQFGSEEYPDFVGTKFNDIFGFFVSGPGISGTLNLAKLPNGQPTVVNKINPGILGYESKSPYYGFDGSQSSLYINNGHTTTMSGTKFIQNTNPGPFPVAVQFNGLTKAITFDVGNLIPGETYTFKMAIADVNDDALDCGIFIKKNSIVAMGDVQANNDNFTQSCNIWTTNSVLLNDTYNGTQATLDDVELSPVSIPSGFTLNADGTISIDQNLLPGTYTLKYKICDKTYLSNCREATVSITIPNCTANIKPTSQEVCLNGATESLTVNAIGTGTFAYQWYRNSSNSNTGGTAITGANSSFYTPLSNTAGTTYYYVTVSNESATSVTSNAVPVTVTPTACVPTTCNTQPVLIKSYATNAFGKGSSGIPAVNFTVPTTETGKRLVMFYITVERDHTPTPFGDNWEYNNVVNGVDDANVPVVTFGGTTLLKRARGVYWDREGESSDVNQAQLNLTNYIYYLQDPNIPSGNATLDLSNFNLPKNAGDEFKITIVVFDNVLKLEGVRADGYVSINPPTSNSLTGNVISSNQPQYVPESHNLLIAYGSFSNQNGITDASSDTWNLIETSSVFNNNGTYATTSNNSYIGSENDGISTRLQFLTNTTGNKEVKFSSNTSDAKLGAFHLGRIIGAPCHCYKPAETSGTTLETKVGISALGRAGSADPDKWPMVRKGGWIALESKTKGFVPNRVAFTDADTPEVPLGITPANFVEGMTVYDTTNKCLKIYTSKDGGATYAWYCITNPACPD